MLNQLFPQQINNDYEGSIFARNMFIFLTLVTIVRSLIHMFFSDGGAQSIASIPLNTYEHNAAETIILMFALWGSSQLLMGIIYIIALWRYQRLIPLLYLLMFCEYSMRIILGHIKPIVTLHTPPGAMADNFMVPLALLLFFLSLKKKKN